MNSPYKLVFTILIAFYSAFTVFANNSVKNYSSGVNKDSISTYYRLMDAKILADSNSSSIIQKIALTNRKEEPISVDFSRVYELSFYLIANTKSELRFVLYSENEHSDTLTFRLDSCEGHYQKVIFPMALGGNVNAEKITSIYIDLHVKSAKATAKIQIDELVFNYFNIPAELNGKPNFDNEILKKEYKEYLENNKGPVRSYEPRENESWNKANKSVKAK